MNKVEFNNACYEVLEILKYVKESDLKKIPEEEIQVLKDNANFNHNFKYNPDQSIKEQSVSKLAKGIIATYFKKYTASEKQQEKIRLKGEYDLKISEEEKRKKYNPDDLFKNNIKSNEKINETKQIMENSRKKWYKRIITFFRKILKKYI